MRWDREQGGACAACARRRTRVAVLLLQVGVGAATLGGRNARAQDVEPSYGRVDGDVTVVAGLGTAVAARGLRGEAEFRLRYLETAGLFAAYEDGAMFGAGPEPQRLLAAGLELRPLFLFRWLRGREFQRARVDLVIDSFGLELGAVFAQPAGGAFGSRTGVQAGIGVELPIFERAAGPWIGLHGGVRWDNEALASGNVRDADDRSAFLTVTLAWHALVVAHVVDLGDRAPR
jgi:hypothetical protein